MSRSCAQVLKSAWIEHMRVEWGRGLLSHVEWGGVVIGPIRWKFELWRSWWNESFLSEMNIDDSRADWKWPSVVVCWSMSMKVIKSLRNDSSYYCEFKVYSWCELNLMSESVKLIEIYWIENRVLFWLYFSMMMKLMGLKPMSRLYRLRRIYWWYFSMTLEFEVAAVSLWAVCETVFDVLRENYCTHSNARRQWRKVLKCTSIEYRLCAWRMKIFLCFLKVKVFFGFSKKLCRPESELWVLKDVFFNEDSFSIHCVCWKWKFFEKNFFDYLLRLCVFMSWYDVDTYIWRVK